MTKKSSKQSLLNRVFSKNQTNQVQLPKDNPVPRTSEEINKEYTTLCVSIGNTQVKARAIQQELDFLYRKADSLGNENAARQELDAKAKNAAAESSDQSAPETTGVDANA